MYKKVMNDDGVLESLNDKRASCILLRNSLLTLTDNLRGKILTLNDLELLEEMVYFLRGIYLLVLRTVHDYCKQPVSEGYKRQGQFYPLIRQARQMEIFSVLTNIHIMMNLLKVRRFFQSCKHVYVLNHFMRTLKPSVIFLEKFLLRNKHFHVVLPPPDAKKNVRYYPKYY